MVRQTIPKKTNSSKKIILERTTWVVLIESVLKYIAEAK